MSARPSGHQNTRRLALKCETRCNLPIQMTWSAPWSTSADELLEVHPRVDPCAKLAMKEAMPSDSQEWSLIPRFLPLWPLSTLGDWYPCHAGSRSSGTRPGPIGNVLRASADAVAHLTSSVAIARGHLVYWERGSVAGPFPRCLPRSQPRPAAGSVRAACQCLQGIRKPPRPAPAQLHHHIPGW